VPQRALVEETVEDSADWWQAGTTRGHGVIRPHGRAWFGLCAAGLICAAFVSTGLAAQEGQSTWSGVYTDAQAARGETVYNANCAVCHGDGLAGSEMGPELAGGSFVGFWDGLSLGDLFMVMSVSMPQDNPGSLETAQYVDVIAYMLQRSEFPSGSEELPADQDGLRAVTIQAAQGQ
jgi:mono/diheme cytochrome c family protein